MVREGTRMQNTQATSSGGKTRGKGNGRRSGENRNPPGGDLATVVEGLATQMSQLSNLVQGLIQSGGVAPTTTVARIPQGGQPTPAVTGGSQTQGGSQRTPVGNSQSSSQGGTRNPAPTVAPPPLANPPRGAEVAPSTKYGGGSHLYNSGRANQTNLPQRTQNAVRRSFKGKEKKAITALLKGVLIDEPPFGKEVVRQNYLTVSGFRDGRNAAVRNLDSRRHEETEEVFPVGATPGEVAQFIRERASNRNREAEREGAPPPYPGIQNWNPGWGGDATW